MTRKLWYILHRCTLALVSAVLCASCSLIYDDYPEDDHANTSPLCYVSLTIHTPASTTRATHTDSNNQGEYDDGTDTDFENYINIADHDFRFYLFDRAGNYITTANTSNNLGVTPGDSPQTYRVVGLVDSRLVPSDGYKAVFIANWGLGNYPQLTRGTSTLADVQATYDYTASWTLNADHLIPMFGVTNDITDKPLALNTVNEIGTINLLRAMTKIEVTATNDEDDDLESVWIERYNSQGYCAPVGVSKESDYFGGRYIYDNDFYKTPSIVGSANDDDTKTRGFGCLPGTGGAKSLFTAYVPEYKNAGVSEGNRCCLKLKFVGDDRIFTLDFKSLQDGVPYTTSQTDEPYDLLRNTYYKFAVKRTTFDIAIVVELEPYISVPLNPDFGFDEFRPPMRP